MATFKSPNWNNMGEWNKPFYSNPYSYSYQPKKEWVDAFIESLTREPDPGPQRPEPSNKRSFLDRTLDTLMAPIYTGAGAINNLVDGDPTTSAWQGFKDGLKASNPFGKGYEKGEVSYSDVLETAGWQPESTGGKIAKGVVGFTADVLLDPTTYLTGGGSAIIKGTGRVGKTAETLAKVTDDVSKAKYLDEVKRLQAEKYGGRKLAVSKDMVNKAKASADAIRESAKYGMSPEMAQEIITRQISSRNEELLSAGKEAIKKSSDEIASDSARFADEYNRLLGIRDARGAGDITFGPGNLPFAPESWNKYNIRLGSQQGLQELSDHLRISHAYAGVRNFIYGSQLGKMFSTTSPMWKLAQDSPAKLWEAMEYVQHTRGLKMDKLQEEKMIRDRFKSLGLTEAENKEVLELLQDRTIWSKVAERVKLSDTEAFKNMRTQLTQAVAKTRQQVEDLRAKRENTIMLQKALDDDLIGERELIDIAKDEYRQGLLDLKTSQITSAHQLNDTIKMLSDEIEELSRPARGNIEALNKLYSGSTTERRLASEHMGKKFKASNEVQEKSKQINTGVDGAYDYGVADNVVKKMGSSPTRKTTFALKEALSNHIFGHNKSFTTISDEAVDHLMKHINDGASVEELRTFIRNKPDLFDPHFQEVNRFIAEELGYKNWNEDGMKYPLAKIAGISEKEADDMTINQINAIITEKRDTGKLGIKQQQRFAELLQKELDRAQMKAQYTRMSPAEFTRYRTDKAQAKMMKEVFGEHDGWLQLERDRWIDDASASESRKYRKVEDYDQVFRLAEGNRPDVMAHIIEHGIFDETAVKNASGNFMSYLNRIIDEVDTVAVERMGKGYLELNKNQQKFALQLATQKVAKGNSAPDPSLAKKAMQEAQKRAQEEVDALRKAHKDLETLTPEEILTRSDIIQTEKARKELLLEQLNKARTEKSNFRGKAMQEREELKKFYEERVKEYEDNILKLESQHKAYRDMLQGELSQDKIDDLMGKLKQQEDVIATDDALETYMQLHHDVGQLIRDAQPANAGKIWLEVKASSDKVQETVRLLKSEFDRIGKEEIEIGRLTEEQFKGMLDQYVPHILTPDGERYFSKLRDLSEHGSKVSHDLGYGVVYNPHAKSRTIKGKSIEQINNHFRDALKGKNLFSENIADIYIARATKHVDLMYDEKYMRTMMNVFGREIPDNGVIEEGYRAVMNHGMLKRTTSDIASMNLSAQISDNVSDWLEANAKSFRDMALASGRDPDEFISVQIEQYLKNEFPDERISEMFDALHKQSIKDTRLSEEILGRDGVPMVEMNPEQIQGIRNAWNMAYDAQLNALNKSQSSAMKRGDMKRLEELKARFEKFAERTPPEIKQINDVIVDKANQARKLQQAKDQSRFLQMYDKFLHFMKLQQTVILPAFHMRNKFSNAYLNWLGVGRDAVDKDLQVAMFHLSRKEGDVDALKELASKSPKWSKRLRPINIPNPHPQLVEALGLNSGQLHLTDLWDLAQRYDVIDKGAFAQDIGAGASSKGMFPGLRAERTDGTSINLDPTDTANFAMYRAGTRVGTLVENSDRLLHFVSMLRQGKSIDEAARSSKKFLFDYGELTAFEQGVMKRIIPYYTWLRKNARLQVSQIIEQPEKFRDVAKVINGIESMTPEEERMNSAYIGNWAEGWIQLPWEVTTQHAVFDSSSGKGSPEKREKLLMNPAMPFMDLNRIPDPTRIDESIKEMFGQMAPQIKVPIEQAMNKNVFFNDEIVGESDNQFTARLQHIMSQFGLYNVAQNVTKDNATDRTLGVTSALTGAKATSVDYETSKYMFEEDGEATPIDDAIRRYLERILGRE